MRVARYLLAQQVENLNISPAKTLQRFEVYSKNEHKQSFSETRTVQLIRFKPLYFLVGASVGVSGLRVGCCSLKPALHKNPSNPLLPQRKKKKKLTPHHQKQSQNIEYTPPQALWPRPACCLNRSRIILAFLSHMYIQTDSRREVKRQNNHRLLYLRGFSSLDPSLVGDPLSEAVRRSLRSDRFRISRGSRALGHPLERRVALDVEQTRRGRVGLRVDLCVC